MASLKLLSVLAATAVGVLGAIGCWLAALFEKDGFGTPRDAEPRASYLVVYGLGFLLSVGVPLALWRWLYPEPSPAVGVLALVLVGALALWIVGVITIG